MWIENIWCIFRMKIKRRFPISLACVVWTTGLRKALAWLNNNSSSHRKWKSISVFTIMVLACFLFSQSLHRNTSCQKMAKFKECKFVSRRSLKLEIINILAFGLIKGIDGTNFYSFSYFLLLFKILFYNEKPWSSLLKSIRWWSKNYVYKSRQGLLYNWSLFVKRNNETTTIPVFNTKK